MPERTRLDELAIELIAGATEVLRMQNDLREDLSSEEVDACEDELVRIFDHVQGIRREVDRLAEGARLADAADLDRLDTEIRTLQARLNELTGQRTHPPVHDAVDQANKDALASLDLADLTDRVQAAAQMAPTAGEALEQIVAAWHDAFTLAHGTFRDTGFAEDDPWHPLLVQVGAWDLDDDLSQLAGFVGTRDDGLEAGAAVRTELARNKRSGRFD